MAGHDDQEGVPAQRLTHGTRQAARTEPVRNLAIGESRARGDGPGDVVDAPVELRHGGHVERQTRQIHVGAAKHRGNGVERALNVAWRSGLARARVQPQHACARLDLAPLRQLHPEDAARAPRDGAASDRRLENRKLRRRHRHVRIVPPALSVRLPGLAVKPSPTIQKRRTPVTSTSHGVGKYPGVAGAAWRAHEDDRSDGGGERGGDGCAWHGERACGWRAPQKGIELKALGVYTALDDEGQVIFNQAAVEISAFDPATARAFVTFGEAPRVDIVDLSDPTRLFPRST